MQARVGTGESDGRDHRPTAHGGGDAKKGHEDTRATACDRIPCERLESRPPGRKWRRRRGRAAQPETAAGEAATPGESGAANVHAAMDHRRPAG